MHIRNYNSELYAIPWTSETAYNAVSLYYQNAITMTQEFIQTSYHNSYASPLVGGKLRFAE